MKRQRSCFASWTIYLFIGDGGLSTVQINLFMLFEKALGTKVMLAFHGVRFTLLVKEELTTIAWADHLIS